MNIRSLNFPHIWDCLSRTRSLPADSATTRPNDRKSKSSFSYLCEPNFRYLVYQGLGVTGPFGLCYVVGVVVGGIGGEGITLALFVASITSLLTGLCYAELLSSNRQCSGNAITAVYQLVGEFPAFSMAVYSFTITCCGFAALSKALSATIEELSHRKLSTFLSSVLGTLPLSELPLDVFASGTALITSVLLACGLKQGGFLRTTMNILCSVGFLFFMIIGSAHTRTNTSKVEENPPKHRQILAGAGMLSSLFFQFLELGRRSKAEELSRTKLPSAITCICGGTFFVSLSLAILLSLMIDNRPPVSGAPLLRAFELRDIDWARFVMGSLQVIILGLGVSEAGEAITRQLVVMASNGFIPSFISQECSTSFTHARAHLVGGIWVGTLAMFLTHVYLLELMAVNILLTSTMISFIVLYRPHRCAYDSLCTVTVTPASKTCAHPSRLKSALGKLKRSPMNDKLEKFLKSGFSFATFKSKSPKVEDMDEEINIPLLSALQFSDESGIEVEGGQSHSTSNSNYYNDILSDDDTNNMTIENELSKIRVTEKEITKENTRPTPIVQTENETMENFQVVESSTMDNGSDEMSLDEDIDMIVAEFKERLRVSTSGYRIYIAPTGLTARKALLLVLGINLTTFFISFFSLVEIENYDSFSSTFKNVIVIVMGLVDLAMLLFLWSLPRLKAHYNNNFTIPFSPFVQFVNLVLNAVLCTELLTRTFLIVLPLNTLGVLWYIFYVSKNSTASRLAKDQTSFSMHNRPREFIRLSPLIPATIYTSTPQNSLTIEKYKNRLIL